jgi:Helix-turn-helix domain
MLATGLHVTETPSSIQIEEGLRTQVYGFVDEGTAARVLNRPLKTLRRWRAERRFLRYYKQGGAIRYKLSELEEFIANSAVEVQA